MNMIKCLIGTLAILLVPFTVTANTTLPGLEQPVRVIRDTNGIAYIRARNDHDLYFMQGRIHARDRLFQMDVLRRSAAGTLAELFGEPALASDIEVRTIGLARAAERSLLEHSPQMIDALQAYSDGVNSWLAEMGGALPMEYRVLGLGEVEPWHPLDSVLVGKALGSATSLLVTPDIDLTVALGAYQQRLGVQAGAAMLFEDLFRSAPFDPASSVPDAMNGFVTPDHEGKWKGGKYDWSAGRHSLEAGKRYADRMRKLPKLPGVLRFDGNDMGGSNTWVVSGKHTRNGRPILANDMHLKLESPAIFHEIGLTAPGMNVVGSSLPGVPCVVRGHNRSIAWGVTNARLDITDVYAEQIVPDGTSPSGLSTLHEDENGLPAMEHIELVFETFRANQGGSVLPVQVPLPSGPSDVLPVLIVPRRNNGPLITAPDAATPLSVQSVAFGATLDPEGFCAINRANNLDEFIDALQMIDFGSQNLTYADRKGNIAYFVTGEVPLREDLQSFSPAITPPFLIRNGYRDQDWIPLDGPRPPGQATPFAILPFDEMPQVINPPSGVIVNANNDQAGNTLDNNSLNDLRAGGNGLYYLNWGGRNFSIRAGRETEMLNELLARDGGRHWRSGKLSSRDVKRMQADTVMNDAKVLTPYILQAWDNASQPGADQALADFAADTRLQEAVERLRNWDFTTPTGVDEGYDAGPGEQPVEASVATTIYSVWRGKMVEKSIDAKLDDLGLVGVPRPALREEIVTALKHLLENDGIGASQVDFFFAVDGNDPATRRDVLVLESLAQALDRLASVDFAAAFDYSTDQQDYRWGRLHRLVLKNPVGAGYPDLNVPPAMGLFMHPLGDLAGFPVDGGFETVDEAPPYDALNVRVVDSDSFMFEFGPTGRFVARFDRGGPSAETSLPGGESALPGDPDYLNLLVPYLRNETFRLHLSPHAVGRNAREVEKFLPGTS